MPECTTPLSLPTNHRFTDLTGMVFNYLTVQSYNGKNKHNNATWLCACECGGATVATTGDLKSGNTKSCGCYARSIVRRRNARHGKFGTRVYTIWAKMKTRCLDSNYPEFSLYGGRGITVCDEWLSFESFYADMGEPPTPKHSIDRIDNNSGYCPKNCRWATAKEQSRNKRNTIFIEWRGERKSLADWAELLEKNYVRLYKRYLRGWSPEEMFTRNA